MSTERHAAEDAPSVEEFERVYTAAYDTDDRTKRIENQFIVYGAGRLTKRSGELLHFNPDWVDRERKIIQIPYRDPCTCRYCQERAQDLAETHNELTYDDALGRYWNPKYRASVRAIPYGWSARGVDVVETFVDEVGQLSMAQSTLNRRVKDLQERAGVPGRLYPHALRAAAGFFWAEKGLEALYLQALMGWEDMRVADRYIRATGYQLDDRIQTLMRNEREPDLEPLPDPTGAVIEATGRDGRNRRDSPGRVDDVTATPTPTSTVAKTLTDFA